jgi:hypothetical protein
MKLAELKQSKKRFSKAEASPTKRRKLQTVEQSLHCA